MLVDAVQWIESSRQMPRKAAIKHLMESIPGDVFKWLYSLQRDDYAYSVPENAVFWPDLTLEGDLAPWLGGGKPPPDSLQSGLDGLKTRIEVRWLNWRQSWRAAPDLLDADKFRLSWLAIPRTKAIEIWGYGRSNQLDNAPASPGTNATPNAQQDPAYATLAKARKDHLIDSASGKPTGRKALKWDKEGLALALAERNRLMTAGSKKGAADASIADDIGIDAGGVSKVLNAYAKETEKASDGGARSKVHRA